MNTHNNMTEADWIEFAVKSQGQYCADAAELGRVAFESRSCLMHAAWLLWRRGAKTCELCGGRLHDSRATVHELCRLRARRGAPTPRLPESPCLCAQCRS